MNALEIIYHFYPEDTLLRRLLLQHSCQVRDKALDLLKHSTEVDADPVLVADGAMLHDLGILRCHAPGILCVGMEPYIAHGQIGGRMLREYAQAYGLDLEPYARICERHTGAGITAEEVRRQNLPIPERDWLPETVEEQLVCFADKFFSKSGDRKEKSMDRVLHSLEKFGPDTMARFHAMRRRFGV